MYYRTYIKGYKLDLDKVKALFGTDERDPDNTRFYHFGDFLDRDSYLYKGGGEDPEGRIVFVVVLAEGESKAELEAMAMPEFDMRGLEKILTEGVWMRW